MTTAVENFRLQAALAYAARGWRVFPVHHPMISPAGTRCSCGDSDCTGKKIGKHPRTPNGLHDADSDPDMIRAWWEKWPAANIGISTGQVSGMYVIDIDPDKGGEESWSDIIASYGEVPATPIVETGSGGMHLYFRAPTRTMRNTTGKLGAGIDTRGDGGYVVAAPSLHFSGTRYAWRTTPEECALADMPAWLMALLVDPPKKETGSRVPTARDGTGQHWLGRALANANVGKRNEVGLWLACQLRDAGIGEGEAEFIMRDYAERAPHGDDPYTTKEAIASLRSAYSKPPREPAHSHRLESRQSAPQPKPVTTGASAELASYLCDIVDRKIIAVPFPWPILTRYTQALIPGTTTVIVGDPGVGKTYFILQCLRAWEESRIDAAVYFIEKNRRFHTMRLLAQLEADSRFLDYEWLAQNGDEIDRAMAKHATTIDVIGKHIYSSDGKRVTLKDILAWITQMASMGRRVIIVDPITAVDAGAERWTKDDDFVLAAEQAASAHGASLIFITHAKKGNRSGQPTGHDAAGGAAYFRFCDSLFWLNRPKKQRTVYIHHPRVGQFKMTPPLFLQIHKARNGNAHNYELAFAFGNQLDFAEQGVVMGEAKGEQ